MVPWGDRGHDLRAVLDDFHDEYTSRHRAGKGRDHLNKAEEEVKRAGELG